MCLFKYVSLAVCFKCTYTLDSFLNMNFIINTFSNTEIYIEGKVKPAWFYRFFKLFKK